MGFTRNRALWALVAMVAGSCGQVNAAIDA
jgi:hypothetical protein